MRNSTLNYLISTTRFTLKPLTLNDVTDRYASWLSDATSGKFISARFYGPELKKYVSERSNRGDVLFLGIFNKIDGLHIGNIKYEPIDSQQCYAVMGILIGDAAWRGKGVAREVILASATWLHKNKKIDQIVLGVSKSNKIAIRAYQKVGFIERSSKHLPNVNNENITMILDLNESQIFIE